VIYFPGILTEIALNQLGLPYHPQMFNHKRYSYTAKTRKMNMIFLPLTVVDHFMIGFH